MAFILGIILLMIINYYHNVPDVGFMMTVMIMDMMLVIGNMMAKKHCDDDSDRDCTFPSFSTSPWDKHWWNAPRNGIAGVCRFVQICTPKKSIVYCHSYPTFGVTFLPSNLRRPPGPSTQMTSPCPCLEQPSTWNLQLQEFFRSYGHQRAKGWLLGCNISGQKPNFWRPRQGFQYFNLVHWTNIDNVLSRLNHSQLFRSTWL